MCYKSIEYLYSRLNQFPIWRYCFKQYFLLDFLKILPFNSSESNFSLLQNIYYKMTELAKKNLSAVTVPCMY